MCIIKQLVGNSVRVIYFETAGRGPFVGSLDKVVSTYLPTYK